jgi:hypothetical protein
MLSSDKLMMQTHWLGQHNCSKTNPHFMLYGRTQTGGDKKAIGTELQRVKSGVDYKSVYVRLKSKGRIHKLM